MHKRGMMKFSAGVMAFVVGVAFAHAAFSGDKAMLEAFRNGEDIHRDTAARVFGIAPEQVTPEQRSKCKMVNFGIIYGISAFGLSQRLKIPRAEAARLIETYFRLSGAFG